MKLVKVSDGLIERDNFLLTSEFSDFLGSGFYNRSQESFTLEKGSIERNLNYDEFVIVVEKEPSPLLEDDKFEFYIRSEDNKVGLEEVNDTNYVKFWKLILHDNYMQGYKSNNGQEWENIGGTQYTLKPSIQGFSAIGQELIINDYRVYRSPYVTIQNYYPNTVVKLVDSEEDVIKERLFTDDHECNIFLDSPGEYKLMFHTTEGDLVYESEFLDLTYGDIYMFTEYDLQLFHKETLLTHKTTTLHTLLETVTVKNNSLDDYENIKLTINNPNLDEVTISLDKYLFNDSIIIDRLLAGEEKEVYIRIIKENKKMFQMNEFTLDIS